MRAISLPPNLFDNGDFDCDLRSWTPSPDGGAATWSVEDARGSDDSGSADLGSSDTEAFVSQCVPVNPGPHVLRGRLRFDAPSTALAGGLLECDLHDQPDCAGPVLTSPFVGGFIVDTDSTFVTLQVAFNVPPEASSASCGGGSYRGPGNGLVFLDVLDLRVIPVLFADGFETGDTANWSGPIRSVKLIHRARSQ